MASDYQAAINSLRAIQSEDWETVNTAGLGALFGAAVAGAPPKTGSHLSRNEQNLVDTMGRKLFGKNFDISRMTKGQWGKIREYAQWAQQNPKKSGIPQLANPPAQPQAPPNTTNQIEQAIENDPYAQAGAQLAGAQKQLTSQLQGVISGSSPLVAGTEANAVNQAENVAGVSPGSAAGKWLSAQVSQAQINDAPLQQALQAYSQSFGQGSAGVEQALAGMGQANALGVATAPAQTWLSDLATHIQSQLAYEGTVPTAAGEALAQQFPSVASAVQQSGAGPGSTGTVPVSQIPVAPNPVGGTPNRGTGSLLPSGLGTTGYVPTTSSVPADTSSAP